MHPRVIALNCSNFHVITGASGAGKSTLLAALANLGYSTVPEAALALGRALLAMAIVFPPFVIGYRLWWHTKQDFHLRLPPTLADDLPGQLLVIALPEEAFFRGYLQTALDDVWPPRWRIFGANVGPSLIVTSASQG